MKSLNVVAKMDMQSLQTGQLYLQDVRIKRMQSFMLIELMAVEAKTHNPPAFIHGNAYCSSVLVSLCEVFCKHVREI